MKNRVLVLFSFLFTVISLSGQKLEESAFNNYQNRTWYAYRNNNQALQKVIADEAFQLLDARKEKVAGLQSADDWKSYQKEIREKMFKSMESFERTPLNPRITGTIRKETFKIEKVIFESQPGFYVTGCLYIPNKRQKPAPAVIVCSGHAFEAFRSTNYQHISLNLVNKGFVVFAFDPIGQGERKQYLNPDKGSSIYGSPTLEHSHAGIQTLLTGTSLTDYFVWDGSRVVDYLVSRKEVDPERIGITGRSGGGTQSGMIAAYDERIYAAAPECWTTNFKRLIQSLGVQDAEQNPYRIIQQGIDHADYYHIRAPKPSLIVTTSNDFFNNHGARETWQEARKSYAAFDHPENLQMVEDYGSHQTTKKNREAVYAFFQKHLNLPGDSTDLEVEYMDEKELQVTETGQVVTSAWKSKIIFDLNKERFERNATADKPQNLKELVADLSGIRFNRNLTSAVYTGKLIRDGLEIEKYFLETDKGDYALPLYYLRGAAVQQPKYLLWISADGKRSVLNSELTKQALQEGYSIIAADLPEIGELHDSLYHGDSFVQEVPLNYAFGACLIGKSIAGIQAEAIDLMVQFARRQSHNATELYALSEGVVSSALLHYVTLRNPFKKLAFSNVFTSYKSLVDARYFSALLAYSAVPGSARYYDFGDLVQALPAGTVKVINEVDTDGKLKLAEEPLSSILPFLK